MWPSIDNKEVKLLVVALYYEPSARHSVHPQLLPEHPFLVQSCSLQAATDFEHGPVPGFMWWYAAMLLLSSMESDLERRRESNPNSKLLLWTSTLLALHSSLFPFIFFWCTPSPSKMTAIALASLIIGFYLTKVSIIDVLPICAYCPILSRGRRLNQ